MSKTTIEWTDYTFNPWRGCTKIAAGCANCYAEATSKRNPGVLGEWGPHGTRVVAADDMWRQPVKWNNDAEQRANVARLVGHAPTVCTADVAAAYDWQFAHAQAVLNDLEQAGVVCPNQGNLGGYLRNEDVPLERSRVFCASLADVFEDWDGQVRDHHGEPLINCPVCGVEPYRANEPPLPEGCEDRPLTLDDVRARLFAMIDATPHLDWLLLTKRPENIRRMWPFPEYAIIEYLRRRDNVWLGTSVATQADADRNIPELLKCRDLSPCLFVSYEPAIEAVDFTRVAAGPLCPQRPDHRVDVLRGGYWSEHMGFVNHSDMPGTLDWIIAGGESGPGARPCDVEWILSAVEQCQAAGVPCFVKQLGSNAVMRSHLGEAVRYQYRTKHPKGGDPDEWPEDLRVREWPQVTQAAD